MTPNPTIWPTLREHLCSSIDAGAHTFAFFADLLGISRSHVVRMVRGNQVPSLDEAEKIAAALGHRLAIEPSVLTWHNDPRSGFWSAFAGRQEYRIEKEGGEYTWMLLSYTGKLEGVDVHYAPSLAEAKKKCEDHRHRR